MSGPFRGWIARSCCGAALLLAPALALAAQQRPSLPHDADPNDWAAYYLEGIHLIDRKPGIAQEYFAFASRLDPTVAEPWIGRAAAWWRDHLWLHAPMWDRKRPTTDSTGLAAVAWLAEGEKRNPFALLGPLLFTFPQGRTIRYGNFGDGLYAYMRGNWQTSVDDFTARLRDRPDDWEAYRWRALARVQLGQYDSAAADLARVLDAIEVQHATRTLRLDLTQPQLYFTLGLIDLMANRTADAKAALQHSLTMDLSFPAAHEYYGDVILEAGDTAGAMSEYAMAVQMGPNDVVAREKYGAALLARGVSDSALVQMEAAIQLDPDFSVSYFNAARCLDALGRRSDADARYGDFLARAPKRLEDLISQARARVGAPAR